MSRIFVSTYSRYNSGNLSGLWLNLKEYACAEDCVACARDYLAITESDDTELMFPDFEGFPRELYSESSISDSLMDWVNSEHEAKLAYVELYGTWDATDCEDRYAGKFNSSIDFAWHMLEQSGYIDSIPDHLRSYFDIDAFSRDLMFDYSESGGHYFAT